MRVLIAEDHADLASSLQRLLQLFGFDATAVTNGADAVEYRALAGPVDRD